MLAKTRPTGVCLPTVDLAAPVWLFTTVHQHVGVDGALSTETFPTLGALVWLLTAVCQHVVDVGAL